jgi:hypothetical protein
MLIIGVGPLTIVDPVPELTAYYAGLGFHAPPVGRIELVEKPILRRMSARHRRKVFALAVFDPSAPFVT